MSKVLGPGAYGDPENPGLTRDAFEDEQTPTEKPQEPKAPADDAADATDKAKNADV